MKNFDIGVYETELLTATQFSNPSKAWVEMWERIDQEFSQCLSHFNHSFIKWYKEGLFHDSILEDVKPAFDEVGKWTVTISLKGWVLNEPVQWVLQYKNVTSFSIHKNSNCENKCEEECLYGEFYRSDHDERKVIHEFFTDKDTFFYVEFEKLIFVEYSPLSTLSTLTSKHRRRFRK